MVSDFSRIITLLRKEKGVTQKQAAEDLGVSQALLSHYEKGIRECGLEFVVRVADYYGVSCDYLLGRSADRSGLTLSVEDIPSPEGAKDGVFRGSVLPTFNKKLISNSLNILYDKLNACPDKGLVGEISGYLMLAVYKMFRLVYGAGPKNTSSMFGVKKNLYGGYSDAAMHIAESNVKAILAGEDIGLGAPLKDTSAFAMTTESLSRDYPLYATSLLTSGGLGTMGYGLGAALGAKMGRPEKTVINIAGDGCFRMNMNEIATAGRYNIPVIEVVINNHVLGMVRQWQNLFYGERYSQTVLEDAVDFVKLAEAMGVQGRRVTTKEEFNEALQYAIGLGKPYLIDCQIDSDDKVFPMVPAGKPIETVFDQDDLKK